MASAPIDTNKYEVLEKIGHGSFGIIRKVRRRGDSQVLCRKEINYVKMSQKEREQLYAEFSILETLKHPNIVEYYHREHLKAQQELYLYMEYCGGGDLGAVVKNLKNLGRLAEEDYVWQIFSQIVAALYRCHYGVNAPEPGANVQKQAKNDRSAPLKGKQAHRMILHRDLKPENIFLGEDQSVKLGDFGLSKVMQSNDFAATYVGTPFYMSPEICASEPYTEKSDIWSLGCIMYELCAKEPPFNANSHIQLAQKIRRGVFEDIPRTYSNDLKSIITECLQVNPHKRPDTTALLNTDRIWLSRKAAEVVETGKKAKQRELAAEARIKQASDRLASLEQDMESMKENMARELEAKIRREWEVKARLEIDLQVGIELERLRKKFDKEVDEKVTILMDKQTRHNSLAREVRNAPSPSPGIHQSSISTTGDDDFPSTTDLSELSIDSPASETTRPQPKKNGRTPFSRSKTTFDSPADVNMAEPSPISIASLSLSPRRTGAAAGSQNIFAEAEKQKAKWEPTLAYSDDEDDIPELPSPIRPKVHAPDPFKMPARPGLMRQKTTATMQKLTTQPTLFPAASSKASLPSTVSQPDLRPGALDRRTSPNRRLSKIPSSTTLATDAGSPVRQKAQAKPLLSKAATAGGDEMLKGVMQRNLGGRTLVELQQARAGGRPLSMDIKPTMKAAEREVATWDPETEPDMPSPFLARGTKVIRNIR